MRITSSIRLLKNSQLATRKCLRSKLVGFSLLEISIVLLIIALVVGGGAAMLSGSVEKKQFEETNRKLAAIQKALFDYRIIFNRLPCPGDLELPFNDEDFALEAAKATPATASCIGGTPRATFGGVAIHAGLVPTRTLRLPDDYAFDGWGRRIVYIADNRFTVADAFDSITIADNAGVPRIGIKSDSATYKTLYAVYALMSFGPNGHGAFPRNGGDSATERISAGSTNADELSNCDCNLSGVTQANEIKEAIQRLPSINPANSADNFDDVVVYALREDLRSPSE